MVLQEVGFYDMLTEDKAHIVSSHLDDFIIVKL